MCITAISTCSTRSLDAHEGARYDYLGALGRCRRRDLCPGAARPRTGLLDEPGRLVSGFRENCPPTDARAHVLSAGDAPIIDGPRGPRARGLGREDVVRYGALAARACPQAVPRPLLRRTGTGRPTGPIGGDVFALRASACPAEAVAPAAAPHSRRQDILA